MKLTRLYTNRPNLFTPVSFNAGLNVVMAEIRLPENRAKDTHNLGKTTFGRLIDFCLLAGRDTKFFLFKHFDLYQEFVFFLEVALADGSFLTIRRGVDEATKISFKKHEAHGQDFSALPVSEWDHADMPFERAKDMLDSLLDWRGVSPWHYRKGLGYQLRSQDDYGDVFKLGKFAAAHADWKPYLAHILGFNAAIVAQHYEKEAALEVKKQTAATVNSELGGTIEDISKVEGLLLLVSAEVILTHIAEVKLTHLGKHGGKEAADVDPGAGSGDSSVGKTRRRSAGDRAADGVFAQYGAPLPA